MRDTVITDRKAIRREVEAGRVLNGDKLCTGCKAVLIGKKNTTGLCPECFWETR